MIPREMRDPRVIAARCVAPVAALLGEGPLWDPRAQKLLFLDIKGGKIFQYDPQTGKTAAFDAPGMVSALGLRRKGGYVCASKSGFGLLSIVSDKVSIIPIVDPEADMPRNRFNDGKVDPEGGFWAGTMDDAESGVDTGSWWRLSPSGRAARIDQGFHVANGPAFDAKSGVVYFTDSARRVIYAADFEKAGIKDKRIFAEFGEDDGYPDGMDIDREGCLWIAFWDGACVRRLSPAGNRLEEAPLPVPRPTSIALVGSRAYVTSARIGLSEDKKAAHPLSGGLFELKFEAPLSAEPRYYEA
jgi:sugar lactone lactonase YvrE